ncbi:MAG: hypothetical protein AB1345_09590 [Chloroflexota bacterium]
MFDRPAQAYPLRVKTGWLIVITVVVAFLMAFWSLWPQLWDGYRVPVDFQHFYWMARFQDPQLFPTDYILSDYLLEVDIGGHSLILYPRSLGYGLLFYLFSTLISPIWLCKFLFLPLLAITAIFSFQMGAELGDELSGLIFSVFTIFFLLASTDSISSASGLPRGFAMPLITVFLFLLRKQKYVQAGILIVLGALFYLPVLPLFFLTYFFSLFRIRPSAGFNVSKRAMYPLILGVVLSGLVLFLMVKVEFDLSSIPSLSDLAETTALTQDPYYLPGGPAPLFTRFPWLGKAGLFDKDPDVLQALVLLVLSFLVYLVLGSSSLRRLPAGVWQLFLAGAVMFIASAVVLFRFSSFALYYPSRYSQLTIYSLLLFYVGLNWKEFLEAAPGWMRRNHRLTLIILLTFAGGVFGWLALFIIMPSQWTAYPLLGWAGFLITGLLSVLVFSSLFYLGYFAFGEVSNVIHSPRRLGKLLIVLVLGFIALVPGARYLRMFTVESINPTTSERALFQFISALPEDTLIAGDPYEMTAIPLFSQRSVLFMSLFPDPHAPILAFFDAYYAEDSGVLLDFCKDQGVDYLVQDQRDFLPEFIRQEKFFFQPYNEHIVEGVRGRSDFALSNMKPVFSHSPFVVVACDPQMMLP